MVWTVYCPCDPKRSTLEIRPFVVSTHAVYLQLVSINPRKASGLDGIPAWLLKENADLLSDTISDIINSSFAERRLPPSWKSADTVPIPKQKPIKDVNKHLRPISLTSILSKVAEEFVVADYLRPSILKKIGDNQFGAIPKSSTTHALISMVHSWAKHTDGTGSNLLQDLYPPSNGIRMPGVSRRASCHANYFSVCSI